MRAMTASSDRTTRRPGPRRREAPVGAVEVRRALLDAAAVLFAQRGIDGVSLRDIAAEADVHFALIRRYIGNRDELVNAVFADVSDQLAREPCSSIPSRVRGSMPTR